MERNISLSVPKKLRYKYVYMKRSNILTIIVFLTAFTFIFQGCKKELSQKAVKSHKELGFFHYDQGRDREAIEELKKAILDNAADPEVYYKLASAYNNEEMVSDAISMYKKAIELNPHHPEAYYELGLIYIDEGMCEEGLNTLKKAQNISPQADDISYTLGDAYYECGKINEAIVVWESLLKNNPADSILHYNLAMAFRDKGDVHRAISACNKALAIDPNDTEVKKLLEQLTKNNKAGSIHSTGKTNKKAVKKKK